MIAIKPTQQQKRQTVLISPSERKQHQQQQIGDEESLENVVGGFPVMNPLW
jgi:hypothetical protein